MKLSRGSPLVLIAFVLAACSRSEDVLSPGNQSSIVLAACPTGEICNDDINQDIDTDSDGLKDWEERDLANTYEPGFVFNVPPPPERQAYPMNIEEWATLGGQAIDILYNNYVFSFSDVYNLHYEIFRPRAIDNKFFAMVVTNSGKFGAPPYEDVAVYVEARPLRYRLDRGAGPQSVVWLQYFVYWGRNQLNGSFGCYGGYSGHDADFEWIDVLVPRSLSSKEIIATRFEAHDKFEQYRGFPNRFWDGNSARIRPRIYVEARGHGFHGLSGDAGCQGTYYDGTVTDMTYLVNIGGHSQQNSEPWKTVTSILRNFKGYYGDDDGPYGKGRAPRGPRYKENVYGIFEQIPNKFPWTSSQSIGTWVP